MPFLTRDDCRLGPARLICKGGQEFIVVEVVLCYARYGAVSVEMRFHSLSSDEAALAHDAEEGLVRRVGQAVEDGAGGGGAGDVVVSCEGVFAREGFEGSAVGAGGFGELAGRHGGEDWVEEPTGGREGVRAFGGGGGSWWKGGDRCLERRPEKGKLPPGCCRKRVGKGGEGRNCQRMANGKALTR